MSQVDHLPTSQLDDEHLAYLLRAIRRRTRLRQVDVARRAGVDRRAVMAVEAGRAGSLPLDDVRSIVAAVDARARLTVWWHGAAADRLLDERHAALVDRVVAVLLDRRWEVAVEVSFSRYGERGSIDVLAGRRDRSAALVVEVKGSLGALEETNRSLDAKARLAGSLVGDRWGWQPDTIGRCLVVPEDRTIRRLIERHAATMAVSYPMRSREVRAWLRAPQSELRGLWFLSEVRHHDVVQRGQGRPLTAVRRAGRVAATDAHPKQRGTAPRTSVGR